MPAVFALLSCRQGPEQINAWRKRCAPSWTQGSWPPQSAWEEDRTMNRTELWMSCCLTWLVFLAPHFGTLLVFGGDRDDSVHEGQRIFVRRFVAGQQISPAGDGLGPVFNHISCAACHRQGGLGG